MNRRDALKSLALVSTVGAVSTVAGVPGLAQAAEPGPAALPPLPPVPAASPAWLVHPLQPGTPLGLGWSLGAVHPPERGAVVVELTQGARLARVHVCQHQGQPRGLAHTEWLDLLLMDGGTGQSPTEEGLGRVVRALAQVIRQNELRPGAEAQIAALMTHGDRVARFAGEGLL